MVHIEDITMSKGMIIAFNLPRKERGISVAEATRIHRELYGYNSHSHYGKYNRRVDGLLDDVGGVLKLSRSQVLLVTKEGGQQVIDFLKERKADVFAWEVELPPEDAEELETKKD